MSKAQAIARMRNTGQQGIESHGQVFDADLCCPDLPSRL